jgi:hypothetical protein
VATTRCTCRWSARRNVCGARRVTPRRAPHRWSTLADFGDCETSCLETVYRGNEILETFSLNRHPLISCRSAVRGEVRRSCLCGRRTRRIRLDQIHALHTCRSGRWQVDRR